MPPGACDGVIITVRLAPLMVTVIVAHVPTSDVPPDVGQAPVTVLLASFSDSVV